ncbi:hypothetical protein [Thermomonospora umbrina]|uniref:Uncharacterized protein n=1 Tax=Thermomonospora umbrina TaxID=111806 RepID=A0A3D9SWP6_9ACTN|nr:hypothetical protein [Thermomonospora umbrina]REF00259.1 hypothetical protein DFJ69_5787 [Thermomonospora umbrina]
MNLADHSLRVATLKAISDFVAKEYAAARKEAEAVYRENGIRSLTVSLPDGQQVASITVTQPNPSVKVDEDALLAWVEEHCGTEVETVLDPAATTDEELVKYCLANDRDDLVVRRVRRVWREELVKQATGSEGWVADQVTGESAKVAEVTPVRPSGAFSLSDPRKEGAAFIVAAVRRGDLAEVTRLALPTTDETGAS